MSIKLFVEQIRKFEKIRTFLFILNKETIEFKDNNKSDF